MVLTVPIAIDSHLENDLQSLIDLRKSLHLQFIIINLFHPRSPDSLLCNSQPVTRSDRLLSNHRDWSENFAGKLSPWIDLDSNNVPQRELSAQRFGEEVSYAFHLGLRNLLLPNVTCFHPTNYVQTVLQQVCSTMAHSSNLQRLMIPLPFVSSLNSVISGASSESSSDGNEEEDVWKSLNIWTKMQQQFNHLPSIELIMEMNEDFVHFAERNFTSQLSDPSNSTSSSCLDVLQSFLDKWIIQPIRFVKIPLNSFVLNAHGFPVLSKAMQFVVIFFMKYSIGIMLSGKPISHNSTTKPPGIRVDSSAVDMESSLHEQYLPYVQYLRYLQKKTEEEHLSEHEKSSYLYFDVLQIPLQPLMDNLESYTYEVFEKDSVKYEYYEKAIGKALQKLLKDVENDDILKVMVVGAGRGPLVSATIAASHALSIPVKILVIEKNPNAIITLKNRFISECWDPDQVKIVATDMRNHRSAETDKYHLIVSELLGSFGDNELSPECLYSTEHNLHPSAISIPSRYTSYLQPISSPSLYINARNTYSNPFSSQPSPAHGLANSSYLSIKGLETPYVVLLRRFFPLAEPRRCWDFRHPLQFSSGDQTKSRSKRFAKLEFTSQAAQLLHGFAGYFDTNLFDDTVELSILPSTHTPNMYSWFPIYFPIVNPVLVKQGEKIVLNIWRCFDTHRVWYEWSLAAPIVTAIHNLHGRSSFVGL